MLSRDAMTAPRQILPGSTYLITRRCSERRFFLRPSKVTNAIFLYVLAIAARRFRVRVHALCVLSNHVHLVVTDLEARLPEFAQFLWALVARATNATLGRWEAFWAPGSYSAVRLESPQDVISKIAYVLANPVAANLVERGGDWPGLRTAPEQLGTIGLKAARPTTFFRAKGPLPAEAELEWSVPPGFAAAGAYRERVAEATRVLEESARNRASSVFLGATKVLAQKPSARPRNPEPRRNLSPRVAARSTPERIEVLSRLKAFWDAYRQAFREWRTGMRSVVFPPGTYLLRVVHGARCAGPA